MEVYTDASCQTVLPNSTNVASLSSKMLYTSPEAGCGAAPCNINSPVCHFANVELRNSAGKTCKGTLLLENPRGATLTVSQLQEQVQ